MKLKKLGTVALFSVAVASAPIAQAALDPFVITDNASELKVFWSWTDMSASTSVLTSTFWDVALNTGTILTTKSTPFGTFSLDSLIASVTAQHLLVPPGGLYEGTLSYPTTGSGFSLDTGTVLHPGPGTLAFDTYSFSMVRGDPTLAANEVGILLTAVHAVPEPGTYALLLAGLGMMAFVARRRMRS